MQGKSSTSEKKISQKMEDLRNARIEQIKRDNIANGNGTPVNEEDFNKRIEIKYLGKMEFVNEIGEIVEKDVFISIEQEGGIYIKYYDEDQKLLGVQRTIEEDIIPSATMIGKLPEKLKEVEEKDIEEAKTIEQVKEEEKGKEEKEKGPQLTQKQVNSLDGPKADLNQKVDGITLAGAIGLEGKYIQLIDIDRAKELIPDLELPKTGQRFIPIEIYPNGTANVVGEDKLKFSNIEGTNSAQEHTTMNNEGNKELEQNIETFNIVNKAGMHCITLSFDENISSPYYELEYAYRDKENPTQMFSTQLETVHEGPLKSADEAEEARHDYEEGETKAIKETVSRQQAEELARAKGWYTFDQYGNKIGLNIDAATKYLEENSRGNKSVQELIDEVNNDAKVPEPNNPYYNE